MKPFTEKFKRYRHLPEISNPSRWLEKNRLISVYFNLIILPTINKLISHFNFSKFQSSVSYISLMDLDTSTLFNSEDFALDFNPNVEFENIYSMPNLQTYVPFMLTTNETKKNTRCEKSTENDSIQFMKEERVLKKTRLARKAELARGSREAKKNIIIQLNKENEILKNEIFTMNKSLKRTRQEFTDFKSEQNHNKYNFTEHEQKEKSFDNFSNRQKTIYLEDKKNEEIKQIQTRLSNLQENSLLQKFLTWLFHFPSHHDFYINADSLFQSVIIKQLLDYDTAQNIFKIAHSTDDSHPNVTNDMFSMILRNVSDNQYEKLNQWVNQFGEVCMKIR
jgi:hypothetical protein